MIAFRASLDREGQHQLRGVVSSRCHKLCSRLEVRDLYFVLYRNIDKFVESCTGVCPCQSVTHSVTRKVNVNVLLPNKRENVLISSVLRGNTAARYSLLLILTVHFVINTCLAYILRNMFRQTILLSFEIKEFIERSIISLFICEDTSGFNLNFPADSII